MSNFSRLITFRRGKIHRYPLKIKLNFIGLEHTTWVEGEFNCICNLPSKINSTQQYIIDLHAGEILTLPSSSGDGKLLWDIFFDELSNYNFHEDLD